MRIEQIRRQRLQVLPDAQIEFKLAKIDPNGNATTGITRTSTTTSDFAASGTTKDRVKSSSTGGRNPWNTQRYLNIWVCNLTTPTDIMGYSTFPADFSTSPNLDGVVIHFNYFGKAGTSPPYNKGRTTTHEVGHWLDLRHIWGDSSSCSVDDGVSDTPTQSASTPKTHPNCPNFPRTDACTNQSPGIMFMNFMDYTDDGCMNLFTNGQIARMRAVFDNQNGIRRQMLVSAGIITNPPGISGPTLVCSNNTTPFIISNADGIPDNNIIWTCSSNLQVYPAGNMTGKSKVFRASDRGPGWVRITVDGVPIQKDIWVGPPEIKEITGPTNPTLSQVEVYNPSVLNNHHSNPSSFQYELIPLSGNSGYSTYLVGSSFSVIFHSSGQYMVVARAINTCGVGLTKTLNVFASSNGYYHSMAYPNPASNTLNIEIDQAAYTQAKSLEQTTTDAKRIKTDPTFDFRLYDGQGNIVRRAQNKGGNVQFNVSNLPTGIYYLHIYDGISEKPEMQQIVVER